MLAQRGSNAFIDVVLQDIEVKVDEGCVFVRLLQTARIVGHREAVDGVGKHRAENDLSVFLLPGEYVNWPDWIPPVRTEFDQKHLSPDELINLPAFVCPIIAAGEL